MFRSILSVIAGYASMAIVVMAGFSIAFVRPDLAFRPGTVNVTPGWLIYALVLSLLAAVLGGWVCRRIARTYRPVLALGVLAIAIGTGSAIHNLSRPVPAQSAEELAALPPSERFQLGRQPDWYAFILPVLGAAGILTGGRLSRREGCC